MDEMINIYQDSCEAKQITLIQKIDYELLNYSLVTDKSRVIQVLVNLMNNAIKFTGMGGRIAIKAKPYENVVGRMIKFEVKDSGVGVMADKLSRIQSQLREHIGMVESMSRMRKKPALGLGVTISNKIIEGLAQIETNHLQISSTPNKGTKAFFFV